MLYILFLVHLTKYYFYLCSRSLCLIISVIIHVLIIHLIYCLVPTPTVSVTALNTQTVGQSLILQCKVTTVRGITSRVDTVWSSGGIMLERMNDVSSTTMNNSLAIVYTDSYTISQLNEVDDGRVIWCDVVINASPSIMASDSITLDVTSKLDIVQAYAIKGSVYLIRISSLAVDVIFLASVLWSFYGTYIRNLISITLLLLS